MSRLAPLALATALVLEVFSPCATRAQPPPPDREGLEETARKLFAADQLEPASRLYEELAERSVTLEERARSLALAAWIAWLDGEQQRVEGLLARLVREAPNYRLDPSQFDPAFLVLLRSAHTTRQNERSTAAAELVEQARARLQQGDSGGAAELLEQALELDPESPLAMLALARVESRRGNAARSLELLDRLEQLVADPALRITRPSQAEILAERGLTQLRAGRFAEAADTLKRAAELEPDRVPTLLNLALARERSGDLAGAEYAYRRAIDLGWAETATWRALASVAARRDDWSGAREHLEQAMERAAPADLPAVLLDLARADRALGRLTDARSELERAESLLLAPDAPKEPGLPEVLRELAFVLLDLGEPAAALERAQAAVEGAADQPAAYLASGLALVELGRAAEAVTALERARELAPERADIANSLGRARFEAGDFAAAAEAFELALELDPSLEVARENLAAAKTAATLAPPLRAPSGAIFPGMALRDAVWQAGGRSAAEVVAVASDGPAARAGLQRGDLVLRFDGANVTSAAELEARLRGAADGARIRLDVLRGNRPLTIELER